MPRGVLDQKWLGVIAELHDAHPKSGRIENLNLVMDVWREAAGTRTQVNDEVRRTCHDGRPPGNRVGADYPSDPSERLFGQPRCDYPEVAHRSANNVTGMIRRKQNDNPFLSLLVLGALVAAAVQLGLPQQGGGAAVLTASAALVIVAILFGALRGVGERWAAARRTRALRLVDIDAMDGIEFEHYVRALLEHRGFRAGVTPCSDDRGVDIVAVRDDFRCAVQVKRHRGLVSRHAVSDAVAGMKHYDCNAAMVVTNSTFTDSARALAASNDCLLVDREVLAEWMAGYQGRGRME